MLTYEEICDRLRQLDELTLLELLDIDSEDIVGHFSFRIEGMIEQLSNEIEQDRQEMGYGEE